MQANAGEHHSDFTWSLIVKTRLRIQNPSFLCLVLQPALFTPRIEEGSHHPVDPQSSNHGSPDQSALSRDGEDSVKVAYAEFW